MSAEYVSDAAEISCRKPADNADNLTVAKIPEYGDDIENTDLVPYKNWNVLPFEQDSWLRA
jgi:hypothetical protein